MSAEVAFAIPLLIVGALLARSAQARGQIDPGFPSDGAVTLRLALPNQGIERTELTTILEHLEDRLRSLPGVESVGSANLIPLGGGAFSGPVAADDPGLDEPGNVATDFRFVTPGYLESLGLPLLAGTGPGTADREREVVVDQALVEALWPGEDPIGRTLAARPLGDRRADFVVVGVVADTRHETLLEPGRPTIYFLSPNYTLPYMTTVVRGSLEPASLFASARQFGGEVHPDLLVAEARDLDEVVGSGSALTRWLVRIVTTLALGAALITAVGLYAVVGQFVSAYRSALGVRRALGARSADLVAVVIGRVSRVLFTGLAIGVAFAGLASAWLRTELVGVGPADPLTWVGSLLAMALLAAAAVALPTRSAVSVSPLDVLKAE